MGEDIIITYLPLPNGDRLVSWHRHEYKSIELPQGFYMIDGGQEDYIRYSAPDHTKPFYEPLNIAFNWVRDNFTHGHIKLKDMDINYIEHYLDNNILPKLVKVMFIMELNFRKIETRNTKINSLII